MDLNVLGGQISYLHKKMAGRSSSRVRPVAQLSLENVTYPEPTPRH